jgi:hypothetical protein
MVSAYKSFEGVYHMSIFRTIIAVCLFSAAAFAQDDVNLSAPAFLDDFNDAYGGAPHQNTLGEVYGLLQKVLLTWEEDTGIRLMIKAVQQ